MFLASSVRRAGSLLISTALASSSLPAAAQQLPSNQQRAIAYEQQSAARVLLIAEAMRIIHAAYPSDPEQWRRAFMVIGRAGDPVRAAEAIVGHQPPQSSTPSPMPRVISGRDPTNSIHQRMLVHDQRERDREAALGRAFGIIHDAHLTDDGQARYIGMLIQRAPDPERTAREFIDRHRIPDQATTKDAMSASRAVDAKPAVAQSTSVSQPGRPSQAEAARWQKVVDALREERRQRDLKIEGAHWERVNAYNAQLADDYRGRIEADQLELRRLSQERNANEEKYQAELKRVTDAQAAGVPYDDDAERAELVRRKMEADAPPPAAKVEQASNTANDVEHERFIQHQKWIEEQDKKERDRTEAARKEEFAALPEASNQSAKTGDDAEQKMLDALTWSPTSQYPGATPPGPLPVRSNTASATAAIDPSDKPDPSNDGLTAKQLEDWNKWHNFHEQIKQKRIEAGLSSEPNNDSLDHGASSQTPARQPCDKYSLTPGMGNCGVNAFQEGLAGGLALLAMSVGVAEAIHEVAEPQASDSIPED